MKAFAAFVLALFAITPLSAQVGPLAPDPPGGTLSCATKFSTPIAAGGNLTLKSSACIHDDYNGTGTIKVYTRAEFDFYASGWGNQYHETEIWWWCVPGCGNNMQGPISSTISSEVVHLENFVYGSRTRVQVKNFAKYGVNQANTVFLDQFVEKVVYW